MRYRGWLVGDGLRLDMGTVEAKYAGVAHQRLLTRHERFLRKLETHRYRVIIEPDGEPRTPRQKTPTPDDGVLEF